MIKTKYGLANWRSSGMNGDGALTRLWIDKWPGQYIGILRRQPGDVSRVGSIMVVHPHSGVLNRIVHFDPTLSIEDAQVKAGEMLVEIGVVDPLDYIVACVS